MITFKKITPKDYNYFAEMNNPPDVLCWMESDRSYQREDFDVIIRHKHVRWYKILDGSKRVGLFTAYKNDGNIYIGIIIDKKWRRNGYARAAIKHYLRATDSLGYDTYLGCFLDQPALPLYMELGYIETGMYKLVRDRFFIQMKRKWKI